MSERRARSAWARPPRRTLWLAPATIPAVLLALAGFQAAEWTPAQPGYRWSFPRDHWSHPGYKTEWWYFTGTLAALDDPSRRFGYQFTFFRVGLTPRIATSGSEWATSDLIMGHAAVSDLARGEFVFSEVLYRTTPFLGRFGSPGDSLIAWSRAPPGTDARWHLSWNGTGFEFAAKDDARGLAFSLTTRPMKPLVLHGEGGYSRKGDGPTAASMYYSFPRLDTKGSIRTGGAEYRVRGHSWMDQEFGSNQLGADQVGWDWFSLRLTDGRDLMLYLLRNQDGEVDYAGGSVIGPDGRTRSLGASDFSVRVRDRWRSPRSGAQYPARWTILVPGADLELGIEPQQANQEVVANLVPDLFYWEGAVVVTDGSGRRLGEGFVELTGYGTRSRPAL